jgi:hypothetical protein
MAMTPEGKVKAAVKRVLTARQIWFYMPVQNGMGRVGIPDFVCCWKGRFLAIETKAPGKKNDTTENQKRVLGEILTAGGYAYVIDDAAQLEAVLTAIERFEGNPSDQI